MNLTSILMLESLLFGALAAIGGAVSARAPWWAVVLSGVAGLAIGFGGAFVVHALDPFRAGPRRRPRAPWIENVVDVSAVVGRMVFVIALPVAIFAGTRWAARAIAG